VKAATLISLLNQRIQPYQAAILAGYTVEEATEIAEGQPTIGVDGTF